MSKEQQIFEAKATSNPNGFTVRTQYGEDFYPAAEVDQFIKDLVTKWRECGKITDVALNQRDAADAYVNGVEQTSENRALALIKWEGMAQQYLTERDALKAENVQWDIMCGQLHEEIQALKKLVGRN